MSVRALPSQSELRTRFTYDPETGASVWNVIPVPPNSPALERQRIDLWNKRWAGRDMGTSGPKKRVSIGDRRFLLHRLIWKWMTGEEPNEVDHRDGDQANNRWSNLRNVDRLTNNKNCALRSDNQSGCAGVYYSTERQKWRAWITEHGRATYLGQFDSFDSAAAARSAAQARRGFTQRHGRKGEQ